MSYNIFALATWKLNAMLCYYNNSDLWYIYILLHLCYSNYLCLLLNKAFFCKISQVIIRSRLHINYILKREIDTYSLRMHKLDYVGISHPPLRSLPVFPRSCR